MIKTQYDALTNETSEIAFDEKDLQQLEKDQAIYAEQIAEEKAKSDAKAALLKRLGITADEAALLLS